MVLFDDLEREMERMQFFFFADKYTAHLININDKSNAVAAPVVRESFQLRKLIGDVKKASDTN